MKKVRSIIAMLVTVVMLLSVIPQQTSAASMEGAITGNAVWNDGDVIRGTVTISGGTQSDPVVITVNGTVSVAAKIEIAGYVRITGGGTLKRSSTSFSMFEVRSGTLTTDNVTIDGNSIAGSGNLGIYVLSGAALVINEGTILKNHTPGSTDGSVLRIYGTAVMNGGIIENNSNSSYGNIYLDSSATFTLNGGIVRNNRLTSTSSNYGGGAFYVRTATLIMNGGSISGHHIDSRGGAIYCTSYGKVYLNGGVISDNSSTNLGDSIFYSCQQGSAAELYIGGDPYITDPLYLDSTKHPYITSTIKQPITFELASYLENRVVAKGVSGYTLTEADMTKVTLVTSGGSQYYAKLDSVNNQLLMTNTNPGYTEKFYINYHSNGGTGTTVDSTAYSAGEQAVIKASAFVRTGYSFAGWNTKADGSGTAYTVGQSIPVTDDMALYAQWSNASVHNHSYIYTANNNVITESCTCGHQETATLTAPSGTIVYDGTQKKGATVSYSSGWLGGDLTVSYANNINTGTATATIEKDNATATANFTISTAAQSTPAGLTKTDETISKKADGTISGLTSAMEYRKEGETVYTAVTSTALENLSAGKYYVRYAGDNNHNPSADTEVIIAEGRKLLVVYKADGATVDAVEVSYGENAAAPQIPTKEGFDEVAPYWEHDGKNITADTEINAVYTKNDPGEYEDTTPDTNFGNGKIEEEIDGLKEKVPFSQEEKLQIEQGADVEIWLEVTDISDSVSAEDKEKVSEKQGSGNVAMYLDVAMFKQVGNNQASRLTQLSGKVSIRFQLPDSYINTDENVTRTYNIIHVHNGEVEIIIPVFDPDTNTLSFETDRFSTYAVVYMDTANNTELPPTGDSFNAGLCLFVMAVSTAALVVLMLQKKRVVG